MNVQEFRNVLERASEDQPITEAFLDQWTSGQTSTADLREQVLHWLAEYNTPGFYGRLHLDHDARHCYQHLQSAPLLLWMAEAVGVEREVLSRGVQAISSTTGRVATVAAAFRRVCPWPLIQAQVLVSSSRV